MTTYNHAYSIAFAISGSTQRDGGDVTAAQLREAIIRRLASISDVELVQEAVGMPWDTYEEDAA